MAESAHILRLGHIVEAISNIRSLTGNTDLAAFEADWRSRWAAERGFEIISEASRHLPEDLKRAHPDIPWPRIAGIGNVLRHDYEEVEPAIIWKIARDDLFELERVCRAALQEELDHADKRSRNPDPA